MDLIQSLDKEQLKDDIPDFSSGDYVRVHVKVVEGARERIQPFEGRVLKRQGSGLKETFTVRRITFGVAVERTFPIHSPRVDRVEVMRKGRVRRAKLYYLRDVIGKGKKIKKKK